MAGVLGPVSLPGRVSFLLGPDLFLGRIIGRLGTAVFGAQRARTAAARRLPLRAGCARSRVTGLIHAAWAPIRFSPPGNARRRYLAVVMTPQAGVLPRSGSFRPAPTALGPPPKLLPPTPGGAAAPLLAPATGMSRTTVHSAR